MNKGTDIAVSIPLKENTNLKAALGYARVLGWHVFPIHSIIHGKCTCNNPNCSNKGKHPATRNGVKDATIDTNQIKEWWSNRPYLNIGIETGKRSGMFVLDVDTSIDDLANVNGIKALEVLEQKQGKLPNTPIQVTGSKGLHYVFNYVEGVRNRGNIFPSIDVRGDGGYIVAAPSIHASGKTYQWKAASKPSEIEVKDAPHWLINSIVKQKVNGRYKPKPTSDYIRILQGVSEGNRNNALVTLIGHLLALKIDYSEVYEIVHI